MTELSEIDEIRTSSPSKGPLPRPCAGLHDSFYRHVISHAGLMTDAGTLARSVARDPCFPRDNPSHYAMRRHVLDTHGGKPEAFIPFLQSMFEAWMEAWFDVGASSGCLPGHHTHDTRFAPRQNIFEAAAESGLDVNRNGMAFCWNDVVGSPTQGHFGGNKERSLKLYDDFQYFLCHQCGIWGFSDQLKARTWQGIR